MADIAMAITDLDFEAYSTHASSIRLNVEWISALRLREVASFIEQAYSSRSYMKMVAAYPSLVERFVEFKRRSLRVQKQLLETPFEEFREDQNGAT